MVRLAKNSLAEVSMCMNRVEAVIRMTQFTPFLGDCNTHELRATAEQNGSLFYLCNEAWWKC
ncbi:hypothetical protein AC579_4227 [Pseudocercospora musae]|uniref:Uncharacterized protein n=1 Tax=Pseudocercospora musae TaxID=113226 RepID=A0A139IDC4_9PEZI|nr:hypothetical protein AC579_4227 [Pseudocercospora musae]